MSDIKPRQPHDTVSGKDPLLDTSCSSPTNEKLTDGQYKDHWCLPQEELDKGYVRPYRESYVHKKCGVVTKMPAKCAETYARNPKYYGSTFCCGCNKYVVVSEFLWEGTQEVVGS